jgi:hypothetical protein
MTRYVLVTAEATKAMVSAGLPHLDGQNNSEVRPVGQFYSGMTADESEAANWKYYGDERLRRAYTAMLASRPPVDYDALAMEVMRKFYGVSDDVLIESGDIPHMAQALRELLS